MPDEDAPTGQKPMTPAKRKKVVNDAKVSNVSFKDIGGIENCLMVSLSFIISVIKIKKNICIYKKNAGSVPTFDPHQAPRSLQSTWGVSTSRISSAWAPWMWKIFASKCNCWGNVKLIIINY